MIKSDILPPTLLENADKALYYAKHNGRNQLAFFEDINDQEEEENKEDIEFF